ncbi:hypothetical protein CHU98_g5468 [Xylaria longipes]|nr:hypothetical protein CHU98_g5468 [Xylaria longipes]
MSKYYDGYLRDPRHTPRSRRTVDLDILESALSCKNYLGTYGEMACWEQQHALQRQDTLLYYCSGTYYGLPSCREYLAGPDEAGGIRFMNIKLHLVWANGFLKPGMTLNINVTLASNRSRATGHSVLGLAHARFPGRWVLIKP